MNWLVGLVAGIISGTFPGMHINNIAMFLEGGAIVVGVVAFVFFEHIRLVFLNVPSESDVVGVHSAHRMLLRGEGIKAVYLLSVGTVLSILLLSSLFPLIIKILPVVYTIAKPIIPLVIISISAYIILTDNVIPAALTYISAGMLGLATFLIHMNNPFLPLLTGLFGVGTMLHEIESKVHIPTQRKLKVGISKKGIFWGVASSFMLAIFPSLSPSQIAYLLPVRGESMLLAVGAVSGGDIVLSLASMWLWNKSRNGAITYLNNVSSRELTIAVLSAIVCFALVVWFGTKIAKLLSGKKLKWFYIVSIVLVSVLSFLYDGFVGVMVLYTAALIGYLSHTKCRKINMMGSLNLTTILLTLGLI